MHKYLLFCLFLIIGATGISQTYTIGEWRDHFPYWETIDICEGADGIYCATPYAVYNYIRSDNSIERFNKTTGLSDVGISAIAFDKPTNTLVIGYSNGNVDFVVDGIYINLPDIKRSDILADKTIHEIHVINSNAFLACGFGIVNLDLENLEVADSYIIGPSGSFISVYDIDNDGQDLYAATSEGIFHAPITHPFLANFETWTELPDVNGVEGDYTQIEINNQIIMVNRNDEFGDDTFWRNLSDTDWNTYSEDDFVRDIYLTEDKAFITYFGVFRILDLEFNILSTWGEIAGVSAQGNAILQMTDSSIWLANQLDGVIGYEPWGAPLHVLPSGPRYANLRRIDAYNHNIWVACGGVDGAWVNNYDALGAYGFVDGQWYYTREIDGESPFDLMDLAINPNDNSEVYVGSWFSGLIRIKDGEMVEKFDENNSTLSTADFGGSERIGVAGVDFDIDGNLWFTNSFTDTPLHVRTPSGTFQSFEFGTLLDSDDIITEVMASQLGYVYCILPRGKGMLVLDHKGTITDTSDDTYKILDTEEGNGGFPIDEVVCVEEDLDGEIWIGTLQGPAVIYNPQSIFSGDTFDAQQILIEQDGNIQILLETETINCIEIDGANRKWIGTVNSGVYLMSEDGVQQIHHFTTENSPLPSNNVFDIAINQDNGEVFFGTEKGIVAYFTDATNFEEQIDEVLIYPNPVTPEFDGLIAIDGLSRDVDVKIADIAGNVVFQTKSNGGRATWDGTDFNGNRVSTGVYLVFVTSQDGEQTGMAKVAFIN